jgi:hypothetical protein
MQSAVIRYVVSPVKCWTQCTNQGRSFGLQCAVAFDGCDVTSLEIGVFGDYKDVQ